MIYDSERLLAPELRLKRRPRWDDCDVPDTPPYLSPVAPAITQLDALYRVMLSQLDEQHHGFEWWRGYLDDRRLALIAEYLIASVAGVSESLADAAFIADELRRDLHADKVWAQGRIKEAQDLGATEGSILRALRRTGIDERRERRARLAREHLVYHLAQAFDRVAAVVVGVCGLRTQIIRADWQLIASNDRWNRARGEQPPAGRQAQDVLRSSLLDAVEAAGPQDWFSWIDGMRNTYAHRAPKINMIALSAESHRQPPRLVHLFERQPKWSMTEAIVGGRGLGMDEVWLFDDPLDLLNGALASATSSIATVTTELADLWDRRSADPLLLVQPGGQWPKVLEEPLLGFSGYGSQVKLALKGGQFRVAPEQGRRMRASGVFNPDLWR